MLSTPSLARVAGALREDALCILAGVARAATAIVSPQPTLEHAAVTRPLPLFTLIKQSCCGTMMALPTAQPVTLRCSEMIFSHTAPSKDPQRAAADGGAAAVRAAELGGGGESEGDNTSKRANVDAASLPVEDAEARRSAGLSKDEADLASLKAHLNDMKLRLEALECIAAGEPCPRGFSAEGFRLLEDCHRHNRIELCETIDNERAEVYDRLKAALKLAERVRLQRLMARTPHRLSTHTNVVAGPGGAFDLVHLPPGAKWATTEESEPLIVRRRPYKRLWNVVQRTSQNERLCKRAVLIMGSPGIGKTWCLEYLLIRSLAETPGRLVFVIGILHYSLYDGCEVIELPRSPESLTAVCNVLRYMNLKVKELLLLHDISSERLHYDGVAVASLRRLCKVTCVVTASPQTKKIDAFIASFSGASFYMPLWSLEEAKAYFDHFELGSASDAAEAVDRAGGIPRSWSRFLQNKTVFVEELRLAVNLSSTNLLTATQGHLLLESSRLVGMFPSDTFDSFRMDILSPSIMKLFHETHLGSAEATLRYLEQVGRRDILERYFALHIRWCLRRQKVAIQRLSDRADGAMDSVTDWAGTGASLTEREFDGAHVSTVVIPDRSGGSPTLYVPYGNSLDGADFLLAQGSDVWVVQVTVSPQKTPTLAHEEMLATLRRLQWNVKGIVWAVSVDANPSHRVEFCEKRLIPDVTLQPPLLSEVPQYVCRVDYWKEPRSLPWPLRRPRLRRRRRVAERKHAQIARKAECKGDEDLCLLD